MEDFMRNLIALSLIAIFAACEPAAAPDPCSTYVSTGSRVKGCKGTFGAGAGASLCPTGYSVCSQIPTDGVTASICGATLSGSFFASAVQAFRPQMQTMANSLTCNPTSHALTTNSGGISFVYGLWGCGSRPNTINQAGCFGMQSGIYCDQDPTNQQPGWGCPGGDFSKAFNQNPDDGVLCCLN